MTIPALCTTPLAQAFRRYGLAARLPRHQHQDPQQQLALGIAGPWQRNDSLPLLGQLGALTA
jgi:hypothetical protein